jgi:glycosyltransferase involved in cell wall biosynthesis
MKIRILETIRQGRVGGGETHLLSLAENLDKTRYEPVILSFTEGPMVEKAREQGWQTEVIHSEKPFDFRVWGKVQRLMKKEGIQMVHAHGTRAASNTLRPAKALRLPFIYTIHGWSFHPDQGPLVRKLRIMGEQWLTSRTDLNISVSYANQQTGKNQFRGFESVVIHNGIDPHKFNPLGRFADVRREIGIPAEAVLILFIARFTHHKQPLKVVSGFYQAAQKMPELRLLMVGEGDAREETRKLVDQLGISDKVYFQDFRSDVPDVLASADIFVLASLWEGLAISLLEAMALGRTVVASRVDGNSEVVKHLENGWLVDLEGMEENLAKAFLRLGSDPELRMKLESGALDTISSEYNVFTMTRETENQYQKLYLAKTGNR